MLTVNTSEIFVDPRERIQETKLLEREDTIQGLEIQFKRRDGQTIWVRDHVRAIRSHSGKVVAYEGSLEDISERKQVVERLHFLEPHDPLTGLPNRNLFEDWLSHAVARFQRHLKGQTDKLGIAVMMLDLDHFKSINDTLGHSSGDQFPQVVAHRLKHCVRQSDTVARLGGDEFTLVLENIGNSEDCIVVA